MTFHFSLPLFAEGIKGTKRGTVREEGGRGIYRERAGREVEIEGREREG